METFHVTISKDKMDFFLQFLELIGAEFRKEKSIQDWAENLSPSQLKSIGKGLEDIENERTFSHAEVKKRIKEYIAEKTK